MRDEWATARLGDVARLTIGKTPPRKEPRYWTDDLSRPFCTIADMDGSRIDPHREGVTEAAEAEGKARRVPAGSLLMSFKLTIGRVGFAGRDLFPNEAIVWIEPDASVSRKFLALALEAGDLEGGTVRAVKGNTLNRASLEAIELAVPPLGAQRRIVDLIDHIDTALAAAELSKRELEQAARHVRATAFGSLTGESVPAGDVFDMLLGRQKSARQSVGDHVFPYIRAANIGVDAVDTSDVQRMNFEPAEQQKYALAPQDVLLVEGGSIGQASLWAGELPGFVGFDKHVIRIRARPNESTPAFALHWSHWARESGAFDEQATGLTIKALGYGRASQMPVPRLSVDEQTALTEPLEALRTTLATQRSHSSALRRFRGEVLTSLLSGDREIPESYDRFLEEQGAA